MLKIKSTIDVITNSSTEVFTLKTTASIKEVSDWLANNTYGYDEPVRIESKDCLKTLMGYGYLFDPSDIKSVENYVLEIHLKEEWGRLCDGKLLYDWAQYAFSRKDEINKIYRERYSLKDDNEYEYITDPTDIQFVRIEELPKGMVSDFLSRYSQEVQDSLKTIDPEYSIDYWMGGIIFSSVGDNTIPYEDWDKINEKFNGTNYHLG